MNINVYIWFIIITRMRKKTRNKTLLFNYLVLLEFVKQLFLLIHFHIFAQNFI